MSFSKYIRVVGACAILATSARAQSRLFHEDFESGFAAWSLTGLWNAERSIDPCGSISAAQPGSTLPSGIWCAYYGRDGICDYQTGTLPNSGFLTSLTPVTLPPTGRASVRFFGSRFAECQSLPVDASLVQVSTDGGGTWVTAGSSCYVVELAGVYRWHPEEFDLAPFLGRTILLRFSFDTVDEIENSTPGWFVDDVSVLWDSSSTVCPAPGPGTCPCTNGPAFLSPFACANSTSRGAELVAGGTASVSADTLVLRARLMPPNTNVLFFQGTSKSTGSPLGDGRLCVAGPLTRLGVKTASGGVAHFPTAGDPSISAAGQVGIAGGTRAYQAYYRDTATFCTTATFNLSAAFELAWTP